MSARGSMGKEDLAGKVDKEAKEAKMGKTITNKKSGSSRELTLQMAISEDLDNKDIKARRGKMEKLNTSLKI
jgi:hypothetical protein